MARGVDDTLVPAKHQTRAEILGLDELGMVAAGKSADFVVLDANPLDDITNSRRIAGVYLRGTQVDRSRLRAGWWRASKGSIPTDDDDPRQPMTHGTNGEVIRSHRRHT